MGSRGSVCWVMDLRAGWMRHLNSDNKIVKWHSSQSQSQSQLNALAHYNHYRQSGHSSDPETDCPQHSDFTHSIAAERKEDLVSLERELNPYPVTQRQNEGLFIRQNFNVPSKLVPSLDDHLTDFDKICGVFLQKLKGRAAIEAALAQTGVILTQETIDMVVKRASLGGQGLLTFFRWAGTQPNCEHNLDFYNKMLDGLGRRKYFDHMEELLQQMNLQGPPITLKTLSIVMMMYIKANRITEAVKTFDRMEEFGLVVDTASLNTILHRLCSANHTSSAYSLVKKFRKRINPDNITYTILIGGWARQGRMEEVHSTLDDMLERGFKPDCITYNYIIDGLFMAGRSKEAVKILNIMSIKGCPPTTINYNTMIRNLCLGGNLDEGLRYYDEMLTTGCKPNLTTFKLLIRFFLKARRVANALETFNLMLENGFTPEVETFNSFIEPLCKFGPPDAALQFYEQMKQVGIPNLKTYKLLLMRLGRFGNWNKMFELWNEMKKSGWTSDVEVYTYVVNGFCNGGKLDEATYFMGEALRKGFCPGRIICSKLMNKLITARKIEPAYNLFRKIKDARKNDKIKRIWRSRGWQY